MIPRRSSLALLSLALPGAAQAATLTVPGQYATIAAALTASQNGDVIEVAVGTYSEDVNITKNVTLRGTGGSSGTILQGGLGANLIEVTATGSVTIQGFTIDPLNARRGVLFAGSTTTAKLTDVSISRSVATDGLSGGAVRSTSGNLLIEGSTFTSNSANGGGAVFVQAGDLTVTDSYFAANASSPLQGAAVRMGNPSALSLTDCTFGSNIGAYAVYASGVTSATVLRTTFEAAAEQGADLYLAFTDAFVDGCSFTKAASLRIENSRFDIRNNEFCQQSAGVIALNGGRGLFHGNFVTRTTASGTAVTVTNSGDPTILSNNTIVGANGTADGVVVTGASPPVEFTHNVVGWFGAKGVSGSTAAVAEDWNVFWKNGADTSFPRGPADRTVDPYLQSYSIDANCANDYLGPDWDSPLVDHGNPRLLDPDGSRIDDGAYAGPSGSLSAFVDVDKDGEIALYDCDDTKATISSANDEVCKDGLDNDCDGLIDESIAWYKDADGDGWGASLDKTSCSKPTGSVQSSRDCNDTSLAIHPLALEICNGIDDDCDGAIDLAGIGQPLYRDSDFDTYGNPLQSEPFAPCMGLSGYVADATDCNDSDDTTYPSAFEVIGDGVDSNCDGTETCWLDADLDTHGTTSTQASADGDCLDAKESVTTDDCNDAKGTVYPGAPEIPSDGIDQDCDGKDLTECYYDGDGDKFGTSKVIVDADGDGCKDPGESTLSSDCNDGSPAINPGATEKAADGVDQDCDLGEECYADADLDGYGAAALIGSKDLDCIDLGEAPAANDCNDASKAIRPGATEIVADGIDQDCDANDLCFVDADGDKHGWKSSTSKAPDLDCVDAGESTIGDDCNDGNGAVFPGAAEGVADGIDQDCDTFETCYADTDLDTFGSTKLLSSADIDCLDAGESTKSTDCDDAAKLVNPAAVEVVANATDDDCDKVESCWLDADVDTYGGSSKSITKSVDLDCTDASESANALDCDDASKGDFPGATEIVGNGDDDDCDTLEACYADADGDKYGVTATKSSADSDCTDAGESGVSTDCDDAKLAINPGASEIPANGTDENCDGSDGCFQDLDVDGHGTTLTVASSDKDCDDSGESSVNDDCADGDKTRFPGATEVAANGKDEDCTGGDACFVDVDLDTYGSTATAPSVDLDCFDANEATASTDCDDSLTFVNPGSTEVVANGIDDDCKSGELCYEDTDLDTYGAATTLASADLDCTDAKEAAVAGDCSPSDKAEFPGAPEVCDGRDDNCDGAVDEGLATTTWRPDADKDAFGDDAKAHAACGPNPGDVAVGGDCDDGAAAINPARKDVCDNGIDEDCVDGDCEVDDCPAEVCNGLDDDCDGDRDNGLWVDGDGDGWFSQGCGLQYVDCNDKALLVHPGALEIFGNGVDDDCDVEVDEDGSEDDDDGDGFCEAKVCEGNAAPGDCDDGDAAISPIAVDIPDSGVDEDCSGTADDNAPIGDPDGDGFSWAKGDCDPYDKTVHPGAKELCNGRDDNCDRSLPANEFDADRDGLSACALDCNDLHPQVRYGFFENCADGIDNNCNDIIDEDADFDLDGYTTCEGDCNDGLADVNVGATEVCNNRDDDCTGFADEGFDLDRDGHLSCEDDCDDLDSFARPGLAERCGDGVDNDCDGNVDQDDDVDADGWASCKGDCDDMNETVSPGAPERCNGRDDDCDGLVDDGYDRDSDGTYACRGDCNDDDYEVYPGAVEECDFIDNDCNLVVDDHNPDGDLDGFRTGCGRDCNDGNAGVNPDAEEICDNGLDDDCADGDCTDTGDTEPPDTGDTAETDTASTLPPDWYCATRSGGAGALTPLLALVALLWRARSRRFSVHSR